MKALGLLFRREIAAPMSALTFASATCVGIVAARMVSTHNLNYGSLIWNLFLAWLPLVFALLASDRYRSQGRQTPAFVAFSLGWLLFFPNAPYIFTDLIHLTTSYYMHLWVDFAMILMCAFTGLVIGFLSLYLMQSAVVNRFGRVAGWLFVAAATGLGGFGIYLGRFLRFNSWDVVTKPTELYRGVSSWTIHSAQYPGSAAFPLLFAVFLFIAYLMLYALTHLSPAPRTTPPPAA